MFCAKAGEKDIVEAVSQINVKDDETVCILIGEKAPLDVRRLIASLVKQKVSFWGGIFPGIIYDEKCFDQGALILKLPVLFKPLLITGLDRDRDFPGLPDFQNIINKLDQQYCALIFLDGLAKNNSGFLSALFHELGSAVSYLGGGAGSLSLTQQPCVFTNDGLFQDAAVLTFLNMKCRLGVRHGLEKLTGPIIATKTCNNKLVELNWKPAFDVYKAIVEQSLGMQLNVHNFHQTARIYPFGIIKDTDEPIIREPIAVTADRALICVGEVPENAVLNIMRRDKHLLIKAAGLAARECLSSKDEQIKGALVVDCVSRHLSLEDDFSRELSCIKKEISCMEQNTILGILSLGEIASYGRAYLEFLNKTCVVGAFHG